MVTKTRHVGIVVKDLERAVSFYEGLGIKLFSRSFETGEYIDALVGLEMVNLEWAKLKLPDNSLLELLQYHSSPSVGEPTINLQQSDRLGCSHIAFTVTDIEDTIRYIQNNGGAIKNEYQISPDGNVKVAYCYDLEGNILEIVQELK